MNRLYLYAIFPLPDFSTESPSTRFMIGISLPLINLGIAGVKSCTRDGRSRSLSFYFLFTFSPYFLADCDLAFIFYYLFLLPLYSCIPSSTFMEQGNFLSFFFLFLFGCHTWIFFSDDTHIITSVALAMSPELTLTI